MLRVVMRRVLVTLWPLGQLVPLVAGDLDGVFESLLKGLDLGLAAGELLSEVESVVAPWLAVRTGSIPSPFSRA
jgi:hypothetical protein